MAVRPNPYPFLDPRPEGWPALVEGVLVLSAAMARVVGALGGIGARGR